MPVLESASSFPWVEAARAIVTGDLARGLEVVAGMRVPSVEAYARLRTAEALGREGSQAEALVGQALSFYRSVGATRYLRQGEALLRASA